ncbi:ADP-glyceromanno-heptose 6-epimerase [Thermodesulfobacteriota bacterium]
MTGGAGFIGSNIVKGLNDLGEDRIIIVDRLGASDKWRNLLGLKFQDYIHKDAFLEKVGQGLFNHGVRALFHMGACSSTTERDADYLMANNHQYSVELAQTIGRQGGARFIYASSAATYGDGSAGYSDSHEAVEGFRPLNMYGYSKQLFDCWALRTGFSDVAVGLKYFNVFGPNEHHKGDMRSVAIRAYYQAKMTGKVRLFKSYKPDYNHGEQCRDFIYVKDAVKITLHFLERPQINGIFNAGTGQPRNFNDLASAVFSALGMEPAIEYIDMPEGLEKRYQYYTCADLHRLGKSGFNSDFLTLEESIRDYVVSHLEREGRDEESD